MIFHFKVNYIFFLPKQLPLNMNIYLIQSFKNSCWHNNRLYNCTVNISIHCILTVFLSVLFPLTILPICSLVNTSTMWTILRMWKTKFQCFLPYSRTGSIWSSWTIPVFLTNSFNILSLVPEIIIVLVQF